MKIKKLKNMKIVKQPKEQCIDFDSDCLCIDNHLTCWLYNKKRGYCPFLGKEVKFN